VVRLSNNTTAIYFWQKAYTKSDDTLNYTYLHFRILRLLQCQYLYYEFFFQETNSRTVSRKSRVACLNYIFTVVHTGNLL